MNNLVFKVLEADAERRIRDMWNANRSLAELCLCSLPLSECLFSLLTRQLALWSSSECVFEPATVCVRLILVSFHASVLVLRCASSFPMHWQSGPSAMSCVACLQKEDQMHFIAFDLWANNLWIKKEKGSGCMSFLHREDQQILTIALCGRSASQIALGDRA